MTARGQWVDSVFICPVTGARCAGSHGNFTCENFGCTAAMEAKRDAPPSAEDLATLREDVRELRMLVAALAVWSGIQLAPASMAKLVKWAAEEMRS